ncbi:MAG: Calx-beta domain-containing protein [Luteolibacter sp.]
MAAVRYYSGTTLLGESTTAPHGFTWNDAPVGTSTLIARAIDNDGLEGTSLPIEVRVVSQPTLNISATDATAGEYGSDHALAFTVTRDGTPSGVLAATYTLSGTAKSGFDFNPLPGSVQIADGQASATIPATVIPDDLAEGDETLILTLAPERATSSARIPPPPPPSTIDRWAHGSTPADCRARSRTRTGTAWRMSWNTTWVVA